MPRVRIGPALPDRKTLDAEIARLRDLGLTELRSRWHTVFRKKPPPHLSRHLLFRVLAYGLQAEHLGDLDSETVRLLDPLGVSRRSRQAGNRHRPEQCRSQARHDAGPGMERADAPGGSLDRRLRLERRDLPQFVEGRLRDHRYPLERT
jgi:Protein of unknown function (DUF2924)